MPAITSTRSALLRFVLRSATAGGGFGCGCGSGAASDDDDDDEHDAHDDDDDLPTGSSSALLLADRQMLSTPIEQMRSEPSTSAPILIRSHRG